MLNKFLELGSNLIALLFLSIWVSSVGASEKVIQKEKMEFERCLEVINTSSTKLLIEPEISDLKQNKRIALFKLSDGVLKIFCDGEKGFVIVSTG